MRIMLFGIWVVALLGIRKSLNLLEGPPILFVLDKTGITDRQRVKIPWSAFKNAYYVGRAGNLYLNVRPQTQYKDIVLKSEEIGFNAIVEVESFMKKYAPPELTKEL